MEAANHSGRDGSGEQIAVKKTMKLIGCMATLGALACATAQAENISSLDTGAGLYDVNNGPSLVDPNWSVSLLGTVPANQTPPGGIPTGAAYLVPNNIGFPFGYWLPNSPTSSWLTYSYPTQVGGDVTDDTFQYQLTFTADNSGTIDINFLSDNTGTLYINGDDLGSNPAQYSSWLATPIDYAVTAGSTYTVDLDVNNTPQSSGNPTGARVEFSGDVGVDGPLNSVNGNAVPDATGSVINLAFAALPFAASLLRKSRKNHAA